MRYDHKVQRDRNAHSRNVCNARTRNACVTCALRSQWERYLTKWTCGVGGGGRKWPTNCANRKSCKAQACTLSASLRSCHLTNHLQSAVHILHFACLAAGQLITCQSLNLQSCHTCYTTLGMGQWRGRSKHRADLESSCPLARSRGSGSRYCTRTPCSSWRRPLYDHPRCRLTRAWRRGGWHRSYFNVPMYWLISI